MKTEALARTVALSSLLLAGQPAIASNATATNPTLPNATYSGARDFDFLMGHWHVDNRRLPKALSGSDEWETFAATQHAQKLPADIGNFDDFVPQGWRPGFVGMSLRVFNPTTGLWSIHWLNNRDGGIDAATGALTPPVVGKFQDGVGVFEANDDYKGQAIRVRYTWSHITAHSARWEQAFSPDGGATWEVNWVMQLTRKRAGPRIMPPL